MKNPEDTKHVNPFEQNTTECLGDDNRWTTPCSPIPYYYVPSVYYPYYPDPLPDTDQQIFREILEELKSINKKLSEFNRDK